jgi:hypothetical protein
MASAATRYSPIQYPTAMGSWMKSAPVNSWWNDARAIARYAYR